MSDLNGHPLDHPTRTGRFHGNAVTLPGGRPVLDVTAEPTGAEATARHGERNGTREVSSGAARRRNQRSHVVVFVHDRTAVPAFDTAALGAGGRDYGTPGLRPHHHVPHYAVSVLDPNGYTIAAVCHLPEDEA